MIALVTGPPGAGKSYYAVRKIVDSLEDGKMVATNVDMTDGWQGVVAGRHPLRRFVPGRRAKLTAKWEASTYHSHDLADLFRLRLAGRGESRGVMVLDEAHRWLNSRLWDTDESGKANRGEATRRRLDVVRFFTLHRKLGWDVYLITQDEANIDRQVRNLFEYHIMLRNLRRMKVLGIPASPVNLFLAVWQWHSAAGAIVKRECYALNSTCKLYDTYGSSGGLPDEEEDDAAYRLPRVDPERATAPPRRTLRLRERGRRAKPAPRRAAEGAPDREPDTAEDVAELAGGSSNSRSALRFERGGPGA